MNVSLFWTSFFKLCTFSNIGNTHLSPITIFTTQKYLCWKKSFFEMKIFKLIIWYPNMVHIMWNDMGQKHYKSFKLFLYYICVFEYIGTLYSFPQIYSNIPLYKMKWIFFSNLLPRLFSNIICKNIVKIFRKFEVG
jgi:hypothetical protein